MQFIPDKGKIKMRESLLRNHINLSHLFRTSAASISQSAFSCRQVRETRFRPINKKTSKLECIWYLNFRVLYNELTESCLINHNAAETYRKRRARLHRDL